MTDSVVYHDGKKWVQGTRSFRSSVTHHETRGSQTYLPKPIMERFGFPGSVIFTIQGDVITMRKGKKD